MKIGYSASRLRSWVARSRNLDAGRRNEEGTTLVEFAMTLPLFVGVLTATASLSIGLYFMQQIGNATANAVQVVAESASISTDPCKTAVAQVTAALPNLSTANFTYTLNITNPTGSGTQTTTTPYGPAGNSFSCAAAPMTANYPITLTVSYTYTWFPVFDSPKFNFNPTSKLSSTQAAMQQ